MIDMEQTVYDILTTTLTGMKWSVGFPQDFRALGDGLGSIKQADNSVRSRPPPALTVSPMWLCRCRPGLPRQSGAMSLIGRSMRRSLPLAYPAAL